jgi:hypothetical protein
MKKVIWNFMLLKCVINIIKNLDKKYSMLINVFIRKVGNWKLNLVWFFYWDVCLFNISSYISKWPRLNLRKDSWSLNFKTVQNKS